MFGHYVIGCILLTSCRFSLLVRCWNCTALKLPFRSEKIMTGNQNHDWWSESWLVIRIMTGDQDHDWWSGSVSVIETVNTSQLKRVLQPLQWDTMLHIFMVLYAVCRCAISANRLASFPSPFLSRPGNGASFKILFISLLIKILLPPCSLTS